MPEDPNIDESSNASGNVKPPVLEYQSPVRREVSSSGWRMLSLGCVIFACFWTLVLSSEAWRFTALFGALGCVSAACGLRKCPRGSDRTNLWGIATFGLGMCAMAIAYRLTR